MSAAIPPLAGRYFSSLCDPKIPQQRRLLAEQLMFIFENGGSYLGPSVPPAVRDLLTDIFLPFRSDQQYRKDATLSISIDSTAVAGRDTLAGALQECGDLLNDDGSTRPAPPDAPRLVCLAGLKVEILKLDISQRIKPGRAVVRGKMIDASMEESAASTPSAPSVKRRRRSPSGNSDYVDGGPSGDEDSGSSEDELSSAKGYDSESSMDVPLAKSRDKGKLAGKAQKRTTKGKGTGREVKGKRTGNASGQRKVVTVRGANKRARVSSENDSGEDADHGQSQRKARKVDAGETLENDEPAAPPSKAPVKPGMPASAPAALPSSAVSTRTTMSIALQSPMTLDQTKSDSSTPVPMEHTKNEKRKRTRVVLSSSPEPDVSAPAPAPASPTASPEPAAPSPDVLARKTRQARIEQQEQAHWDTQAKGLAKWKGKGQWENTWREAGRDGELPSIMVPPGGIEHVYFLGTRMKIVTFAFLRSCNIRARISPDNATIIIVASRPGTYRVSDEVREYLALAKRTGAVVVSDVWVESCEREQCFVPLEAYRVFDAPE